MRRNFSILTRRRTQITEAEKLNFVEFISLDPHPAFQQVDSDHEEWLTRPIRSRADELPVEKSHSVGGVKKVDHPRQLMTPAETPEPEISQQISQQNSEENSQSLPETGVAPLDIINRPRSKIPSSNLGESI